MSEADEKPKGEEEDAKVETAAEETKATEDVEDDSKQTEEVKEEENVNKGEVSSSEEKDSEVNGDDSEVIIKAEGESENKEGESENKEGEGDLLDESILDQSEVGDTKDNLDTSEVITVEDTNEGNVPSKTVPDVVFYDKVSEEEKKFYEENGPSPESVDTMNMQCTACWKQVNHHVTNNIMRHPDLGVAVCRSCKYFYDGDEAGEEWEKDEEGSDVYCKWCAQGGEVVGCDKCTHVFCKRCITRNLGRKKFSEINDSEEWGCFSCDPSQIYKERALMYAFSKWASDRKNKKKIKEKMKVEKRKSDVLKKNEIEKKKREDAKKRHKEQEKKNKIEEEASKVDNFIDENIHEAFDTLNIYQKCLQDEHKKWMRIRKSMNPNNTAMVAKSLRRIYAITKQNMELLDTALVQGYGDQFPEESDGKLKFGNLPNGDNATPSKSKPSPNKRKMKATPAKAKSRASTDNDIEVEEIVVNGEPVFGSMGDSDGVFDPSMLCSVEITAERDSDSSSPPPPKKQKISRKSTTITPVASKHNGPLRISKNMFTKKKKTPSKLKAASTKAESDSDIEEITIIDDDDSTGYVSQSTLDAIAAQNINQKANKFINSNKDDDSFDSDVSLE